MANTEFIGTVQQSETLGVGLGRTVNRGEALELFIRTDRAYAKQIDGIP